MPKLSSKPKSEYAIQTVTNALRMLEIFDSETDIGVSDLSRRLGLHKNNAFRLLATLELRGYIQQNPATELYALGPRCLELGHAFARSHPLMKLARPVLEELATGLGETAHLGVLSGPDVVHLDGVQPDQLVLTALRIGRRFDAHCTALGKVLLSGEVEARSAETSMDQAAYGVLSVLEDALSSQSADGGKLARHTDSTVSDPTKLVEELRTVGLRGYATDFDECAVGLRCVAAPIRNANARVVGALSLSGPSMRLDEKVIHGQIAQAVQAASLQLSRALGAPV